MKMIIRLALVLVLLTSWPALARAQQQIDATDVTLGTASAARCVLRVGTFGAGTPSGGNVCDLYLDRTTGDLWTQLSAGVWSRLPRLGTANIWTQPQTVAAAFPAISLIETDQTANARLWRLAVDAQTLYLQALSDDAAGGITALTVDRGGVLQLYQRLLTPAIGAVADLVLQPNGDLVTDPQGKDILPARNYDVNLGALNKRYLSLNVANLLVESLVAQDVMATIGGHVMVAPTTQLTADVDTTGNPPVQGFCSKDNNMANGDIVYLQTAPGGVPQFEAWQVTTGPITNPGCTPPIAYGAVGLSGVYGHHWYAGDAIVNTGQVGAGYLDLYAMNNIRGLQYGKGPSIVGNVRTGSGFNDIAPRWALGNLNGAGYGHTSDIYGFAAGDPDGANLFIDATFGFYLRKGQSAPAISLTPAGVATFNGVGTGLTSINGGNIQTQTITANALAAGAITADKLAVGAGANMIGNSECRTGTADWHLEGYVTTTFSSNFGGSGWGLNNEPSTCYYTDAGSPANGAATYGISRPYPAVAGGTYEASIYLGNHRTSSYVALQFLDVNGAILASNNGTGCAMADGQGGSILTGYCRSGIIAVAPANTSTARLVIVTIWTGEAGPFVFFVRAYLGQTAAGATQLANWSPAGLTEVYGGLIRTASIVTANLAAGAVTASTIAAGTITAAQIAAGTITSAQIAANTITAGNIAANTITAAQLNVAQLSAITADLGSVTAGQIVVGSGNKLWLNDAGDGGIRIGGTNKNAAPFRVDADGTLQSTSGIIGGVQINNNSLVAGGVTLNSNGITIAASGPSSTDAYKFTSGAAVSAQANGNLWLTNGTAGTQLILQGADIQLSTNGGIYTSSSAGMHVGGTLNSSGDFGAGGNVYGTGFAMRTGTGGSYTGGFFDFNYSSPNLEFYSGNGFVGYVNMTYSDARLKRNIQPLPVGLDAVLRLTPRQFEWIDATIRRAGPQYGLLAQDVAVVLPAVAYHGTAITPLAPDGVWTVDYPALIPVLVKAIQELDARIKVLEGKR